MPSALGLKHPAWDLSRLSFLSGACRKLCTWVSVHVGIGCARGCLCTWAQRAQYPPQIPGISLWGLWAHLWLAI